VLNNSPLHRDASPDQQPGPEQVSTTSINYGLARQELTFFSGSDNLAKKISDYREEQFIYLLQQIFISNTDGTSETVLADMLDNFSELAEHPAGTDLIYWPEDGAQCSPEGITATVKEWRAANGLPGFKQ
jgi:hypothetical protein